MKFFGTVKSFDEAKGLGSIKPEQGGDELGFEKSAISWTDKSAPKEGQRLSYDVDSTDLKKAINLQTV